MHGAFQGLYIGQLMASVAQISHQRVHQLHLSCLHRTRLRLLALPQVSPHFKQPLEGMQCLQRGHSWALGPVQRVTLVARTSEKVKALQ